MSASRWKVVFDGSTQPGSVRLGDGIISAVAHFSSDDDARLFFGLLNEMRDEAVSDRLARRRLASRVAEALSESER